MGLGFQFVCPQRFLLDLLRPEGTRVIIWSQPLIRDKSWELPELIPVSGAEVDKRTDFRRNTYICTCLCMCVCVYNIKKDKMPKFNSSLL